MGKAKLSGKSQQSWKSLAGFFPDRDAVAAKDFDAYEQRRVDLATFRAVPAST